MASESREVPVMESSKTPPSSTAPDVRETQKHEFNRIALDHEDEEFDINVPASETASVSSSLYEHVEENGRTYHKYKEGKYVFPNDELEQNRLDLQHHLCKFALHGRLNLAPLEEETLKNVLDIATGTGIWAIEFANEHPQCAVIGSDLSPIQPEFIPENLTFVLDDADDEWIYQHPFDYIHGRYTTVCFTNPQSIFQKAFDALNPGGYLEMQDPAAPMRDIDGTLDGTWMLKCGLMLNEAFLKRGIDMTSPSRYKSMMEAVGFVDVVETVIEYPVGTWAKSRYHKTIGAWYLKDLMQAIEGVTMGVFTRMLGMAKEEVDTIIEQVKTDMQNKSIHAYQAFYVVYGRKPKVKT